VDESASLVELAKYLAALTESASAATGRLSEKEWREPYATGKWTRLEVLGHLVDSAAQNHQRFARALHQESIMMASYEGDAQVRVQHYAEAPIVALAQTWRAYNGLLRFVLAQISTDKEQTACSIGAFAPMSLRELAFDYVAHLEHHLRQILSGRDTLAYSGMPWPPETRWKA
jgi:hypothetical protein